MDFTFPYDSPLGRITMGSDGDALIGLWFDGQKFDAAGLGETRQEKHLPVFSETARWLDLYFSGKRPDFTPPLAPRGSEFRRAVWKLLLRIPYGETTTYGALAAELAKARGIERMSARAVGGAVGHNPVSLIVPCHRVVGKDGRLTGYAGGLDRKKFLLDIEQRNAKTDLEDVPCWQKI